MLIFLIDDDPALSDCRRAQMMTVIFRFTFSGLVNDFFFVSLFFSPLIYNNMQTKNMGFPQYMICSSSCDFAGV